MNMNIASFCILSALLFKTFISVSQNHNPDYDSALAARLGADDYGMKRYILVILKTGENRSEDKAYIDSCFRGHFANIKAMVENGKLLVAGPLGKNDLTYRGIFILNAADVGEATSLLSGDAAVESGLLRPEYYNWYGSAALSEYIPASRKIWKVDP